MPRVVIVGGGIAGLAAARTLAGSPAAPRVTVVEASDRLGGKLRTEHVDGFLVEAGADSFGTRPPARDARSREGGGGARELVEELGLADQVVPTPPKRVLVLRGGRLEELPRGLQLVVPTDLGEVFRSRLLSLPAKLRVAMELARRPGGRKGGAGETVAAFLHRHFGREYTERIAGPLLAGIHSADPDRLSLRAAFPMLAGLEARWGSLVRGARRAEGGGGPSRVTLAGGMGTLVDALAADLSGAGVALVTRRRVRAISRDPEGNRYRIEVDDDVTLLADAVILTTPPAVSAALWEAGANRGAHAGDGDALAAGLRTIPLASTATVSLGFRRDRVRHPLDALGFLVPPSEGRPLSACTFASSKFPGRAPGGAVLVRAYLGGDLPESDDALAALALSELSSILGITGEPRVARVHRFRDANPRYEPGHRRRVAELEAEAPPGLAIAGCAYHGVGIPDCIASGRRAAGRILEHLGRTRERAGE